jgi:DNA-binding beta-propeller fold protein YncE
MFFSPNFELKSNIRRNVWWLAMAVTLCLVGIVDSRSSAASPKISSAANLLVDSQAVVIDTQHPALDTQRREPQTGPVTTPQSASNTVEIQGLAKRITARPGFVWVDLYFVNKTDTAYADAKVTIDSNAVILDVNEDPFSDQALPRSKKIGGIAALGVGHLAIALKTAEAPTVLNITVTGAASSFAAQNSAPLAATPDGTEVWAVISDANRVAVVDTASDTTVTTISVPAQPSSLAIAPDGKRIFVASSTANTLVVIDRASREIVQTFTERDGLGRDPRNLVLTPDGSQVFVSSYVSDRISRFSRAESGMFESDGFVNVGRRPTGMAVSSDSKSLFVAHYLPRGVTRDNETWVSQISTQSFSVPQEIIWRDIGNTKEGECFTKRFGEEAPKLSFEGVATQFAGVFLPPAAPIGWIPGLRTGPVAIWESAPDRVIPGVGRSTFSPAFLFYMNTGSGSNASVKLHPQIVDVPDANPEFLRCAKLDYDSESVVSTPVPGEQDAIYSNGAAIPTGSTALSETGVIRFVAFTRGGRRALALSYTSDELQVYDAVTQQHLTRSNLKLSGSNPKGIAVLPNGRKGYVLYENSLHLSVLDLSAYSDPLKLPAATFVPFEYRRTERANNSFLTETRLVRLISQVPQLPAITEIKQLRLLDQDPLAAEVRRGRILFESSNPEKYPELSGSRQSSCVTCHPGGGHDGTVWGTMEGERRTLSLHGGVAGRGWLHQSGTHKDILEFVEIVVPERLGGSGLSPQDYNSLARYVGWHIPKLQAPAVDPAQAARGSQLFSKNCSGCHTGPTLTGGQPDSTDPWLGGSKAGPILTDIGTATSSAGVLIPSFFTSRLPAPANELYELLRGDRTLGSTDPAQEILGFRARPDRKRGDIRPPALTNVWDYSAFFHDGRYSKLEEVIDYLNSTLGLSLSEPDKHDLIAFLRTL